MKTLIQKTFANQLAVRAVLTVACALFLARSNAQAQSGNAPVVHFGTFTMQSSFKRCLNLAEAAMARRNYTIYARKDRGR